MHRCQADDNMVEFFREAFRFRLQPSLLGLVTDCYDRLSYAKNNPHCPEVNELADIHDLLVDSPKNGYTYTKSDFEKWQSRNIPGGGSGRTPAFKADLEQWVERRRLYGKPPSSTPHDETRSPAKSDSSHNVYTHALDLLHFEVIKPHVEQTADMLEQMRPLEDTFDTVFRGQLDLELNGGRLEVNKELSCLRDNLKTIFDNWTLERRSMANIRGKLAHSHGRPDVKSRYQKLISSSYAAVRALEPRHKEDFIISRWTQDRPSWPTTWDLVKASVLAERYRKYLSSQEFAWEMVGRELLYMKAHTCGKPFYVKDESFASLKVRNPRDVEPSRWGANEVVTGRMRSVSMAADTSPEDGTSSDGEDELDEIATEFFSTADFNTDD